MATDRKPAGSCNCLEVLVPVFVVVSNSPMEIDCCATKPNCIWCSAVGATAERGNVRRLNNCVVMMSPGLMLLVAMSTGVVNPSDAVADCIRDNVTKKVKPAQNERPAMTCSRRRLLRHNAM